MKPTICLLAGGTLGDVAPFVALGRGLRDAGLAVRLVTHAPFAPLALAHGLAFAELGPNPVDLLHDDPAALTLTAGPFGALRASAGYVRRARPLYARMLDAAWEGCRGAGALVVGLPTLWGADLAEVLGVPLVVAPLQPLTPTGDWPSALLPLTGSLGAPANRLSHRLVGLAAWLPWRPVFDAWRSRVGNLPPARADHLTRLLAARVPFVYGFSPWLVARPADWPRQHVVAGAWRLPDEPAGPPSDLARFLAAGPPPAYVGFGSMGLGRPLEDAVLALDAARRAGRRLVLLGGPAARAAAAGRSDVLVLERAPHASLLPRVSAAVHHGGAGTTHAALRAGVPMAAVPFAADQPFWGARAAALGAGPPPVARRALDAERLAGLIVEAGEVPMYRRRTAALAALLRAEDGVGTAVRAICAAGGW